MDEQRSDRQIRRFEFETRVVERKAEEGGGSEKELYVEGYAARFNSPTVLFEYEGREYKEQIAPEAFNDADMTDVVMNYNHGGKVVARTRNKTLELKVDDKGLHIRARLDGTEEGRRLYEEIQGGYIDRMSFAFTAVDIPAYDDTSIEARKADVVAAQERAKNQALSLEKSKLALKCQL